MSNVTVYTKDYCPFCQMAKNLLAGRQIAFEEINLSNDSKRLMALVKQTGMRTLPQIFFGERFIGGYQQLAALDQKQDIAVLAKTETAN